MKIGAVLNAEKTLPLFLCFLFRALWKGKNPLSLLAPSTESKGQNKIFWKHLLGLKQNTSKYFRENTVCSGT